MNGCWRCCLYSALLFLLVLSSMPAAGIEIRLDRSWRARLLETLAEAGLEDRKLFAQIAVEEMIYAYDAELHRLSADSGISEQRARQWASGIGSYLDRLQGVLARLPTVTRVAVIAERIGPLRLIVGGTPVVISGPDFARQESLEATIFDAYCLRSYCDLEADDLVVRIAREARSSRGFWSISDRYGSVYKTDDGLNFLFADLSDLAQKKSLSEKLAIDLRVVAGSLSHVREQGVPVFWDHVYIQSGSRPGEYRLLLNDRDDYLVMTLSVLDDSRPVWLQARDWVRAKAEGRYAEVYFRDVESLLQERP